jgi:hypothetical protein
MIEGDIMRLVPGTLISGICAIATAVAVYLLAFPTVAEVVRIDVDTRSAVADGKSYGLAGPYERVAGRIYYAVDPKNPANRVIRDIDFAPTNDAGLIEFSSDFYLLKPVDAQAGNKTVFVDVMNRGGKRALGYFNLAPPSLTPVTEADLGDGFLMREGFSVLYVGWQFDAPRRENFMRVYPPVATDNGETLEGLVRSDFVVTVRSYDYSLGDRGHIPYAVVDPDDRRNQLTVRDSAASERELIPRGQWQFGRVEDGRMVADPTRVYLSTGFEPNKIYEVVFVASNPPIAGLGLAAMRDTVSHLKYNAVEEFNYPAGAIQRAITFGNSQAGRLLRHFLYDGFNIDEQQRMAFDGLIPHLASNATGSFNHRFAQPSRAVDRSYLYPGDQFPFSDVMQADPVTGVEDSLLARLTPETIPKVFYTNTSTEYWRLPTALIHSTPDGEKHLPPADTSRIFLFAGTQHVPARFPETRLDGLRIGNPNNYRWFLRALLLALNDWIADGTLPPESSYPTREAGTLAELEDIRFPTIPRVRLPSGVSRAYRLDYGPRFISEGIITNEPPIVHSVFPFLVAQVDEGGNEIAGLRSPEQAVPLATYTGWSPFNPISTPGSYIPFARTRADREASGDERPSIEELYDSREQYLGLVASAGLELIESGYILSQDLPAIIKDAGWHWDYLMSGK